MRNNIKQFVLLCIIAMALVACANKPKDARAVLANSEIGLTQALGVTDGMVTSACTLDACLAAVPLNETAATAADRVKQCSRQRAQCDTAIKWHKKVIETARGGKTAIVSGRTSLAAGDEQGAFQAAGAINAVIQQINSLIQQGVQ